MKIKITGIFFLLCLVTPLVATFTILHFQKKQVKEVIKRQVITGMKKKELVLLKFIKAETQTQLRWEHAGEFEYRGQMYDVVETIMKGDSIYFRCWWDHEETKLNSQLDELLAVMLGTNPIRKENQKRWFNFYKSLVCAQLPVLMAFEHYKEQLIYHYQFNCYFIFHPPPVPPPQIG